MASKNGIADSTDWLNTSLSSFAPIENALRCQVCKDFFDSPMMTSCSHTFCSLCIRRCLSADGKCPACRAPDQTSKLRRNWTIQEVVDAFQQARPEALELAKSDMQAKAEGENPRKRKRTHATKDTEDGESAKRQTRSQARGSGSTRPPASQEVIILDSEDGEDEYLPDSKIDAEGEEEKEPEDGLVACPMCSVRMKEELVFPHLDQCDGKPKLQSKRAKPTTPPIKQPIANTNFTPSKQIPHLNYSLLKEAPLKKKLSELGIPTWGSRQLLIRRHTQWVDIFNANCDSPRPRSNRELLKELDIWERTQGGHAPAQGQSVTTGVMKKDFDGAEWSDKHKNQFDDLIAQARIRAKEKKEEKEAEKSDGTTINGTEPIPLSNQDPNIPDIMPSIENNVAPGSITLTSKLPEAPITALSILSSAAQDLHTRHTTPPKLCSEPHSLQINEFPSRSTQQISEPLSGKFGSPQGVKRLPMFQVPEDPIQDVEGIGGGSM